jgi:hypothetical protein
MPLTQLRPAAWYRSHKAHNGSLTPPCAQTLRGSTTSRMVLRIESRRGVFERQRHPGDGTCTAATSDEYINEHSRNLERFNLSRDGPDCRVEMPVTSRTVSRRAQLALRFLSRQPKALPIFPDTRSPSDSTLSFGSAEATRAL